MPPTGNQSSNVENKKIKRNLLMKLNGNLSLTLTIHKIENGEFKMLSKCWFSNRPLRMALLGKLEFISDLLVNDKMQD